MLIRLLKALLPKKSDRVSLTERKKIIERLIYDDKIAVSQGRRLHVGLEGIVSKTIEVLDGRHPNGYYINKSNESKEDILAIIYEDARGYELVVSQHLINEVISETLFKQNDVKYVLTRHITLHKALMYGRLVDLSDLDRKVDNYLRTRVSQRPSLLDARKAMRLMNGEPRTHKKPKTETVYGNDAAFAIHHILNYPYYGHINHDDGNSFIGKKSHSNSGSGGGYTGATTAGVSSTIGSSHNTSSCFGSGDTGGGGGDGGGGGCD